MLLHTMTFGFRRSIVSAAAAAAVVLAIHAPCAADIQRRELVAEAPVAIELTSGRRESCGLRAWSGDGLEGTCGTFRWEDLKPGSVIAVLKACVPAKDGRAAADAAAIALALPESGAAGRSMVDWARRQGATPESMDAARMEADRLRAAREERARKAEVARLSAISPEAPPFPSTAWKELDPTAFDEASARNIEVARAMLAKAGASGTLHESPQIALLVESGDPAFRNDAAKLEAFYMRWSEDLGRVGAPVKPQGKIPVILAGDRDRWRLLVAAAGGIDPARYPDVLVLYPPDAAGVAQPVVLVAPNSDRALQAYHASVGVARAMLHWARTAERGPPWLNEGLPRVMAEIQTPMAAMDESLRRDGLVAVRAGTSFRVVLESTYTDPMWTKDFGLAQSMSYMFVRWLYEKNPDQLLRFAKANVVIPASQKSPPSSTPSSTPASAASSTPLAWPQRFERVYGSRVGAASSAAEKWFYTND
ncbi:MAG: hypothetical protein ACKO3W_07360 [bacterium]